MEWLFIALLIVLPLIGLAIVNANNDGFGYQNNHHDSRPWYEREKFERADFAAPRYYQSRLNVHNAESGNNF